MKCLHLSYVLLACSLLSSVPSHAQDTGYWRATSNTARHITGDVGLSSEKISLNFSSFWIAQIRPLTPAELSAIFSADPSAPAAGNLYRLDIPSDKKLLHKSTLCGEESTHWLATYTTGRNLQLAFFSTAKMPVLTPDALASDSALCGVFGYAK